MLRTTVGQLIVNEALPPDLRDYSRRLDKKGTGQLFQEIAGKHPEKYKEIAKKMYDIGRMASTESGGYSFGLDALVTPKKTQALKEKLLQQVAAIQTSRLSDADKQKQTVALLQSKAKDIETHLYNEGLEGKNPLAMQIASGARGKPANFRSVLFGDMMYEDHRGNPIPIPVLHSYSQGLTPAEYWAGTFGTRKGVADLKFATQDAGAFGKQLNQVTHRLVIAGRDADKPDDNIRGVPMPTDDNDNEGALLAAPVGSFKRNQIITPQVLAELKSKGHTRILVRSPMVGGHPEGGLYSSDVGVRERGGLAAPGDNVGMAAAQSLAEPVTQAQISSKHLGGVAGAGGAISGFKYINQLVQVPKTFTGGASHAQTDGKVGTIYDAPAGGKYIMINGMRHFVSAGLDPKVRTGNIVEAGDVISDGLPNPAEIVHHKGIGEGRRYFVDIMRKVYKDSGMKAHRRNIELLSRGLINHVQLTDEMGDYIPGDTVPYDVMEHTYQPRDGHLVTPIKTAVGKYLERPVLHYTIGTKIKPTMLHDLQHFGVKNVTVHNDPPPFHPVMMRALDQLTQDPDWMTRQLGTNLKKGLLTGAHRGATSDALGTSFVPGLSSPQDFGRVGKTKSWQPSQVVKTELLHPEHEQFAE
jgi:DNA-directed RNA polymerase subunit beta'